MDEIDSKPERDARQLSELILGVQQGAVSIFLTEAAKDQDTRQFFQSLGAYRLLEAYVAKHGVVTHEKLEHLATAPWDFRDLLNLDMQGTEIHPVIAEPAFCATNLAAMVDQYLVAQRLRVDAGEIKGNRYIEISTLVGQFRDFVGGAVDVKEINGEALNKYLADQKRQLADGKISQYRVRDRLAMVKQFFKWCYVSEIIDTEPRLLASKEFSQKVDGTEPEPFNKKEIDAFIGEGCDERTKLFYLLSLNCGMYASDMGALRHAEVDWECGRIKRKRTKTEKQKNVPVVDYPLWPETFRLLKKFRSDPKHSEVVLLTARGEPIAGEELEGGKRKRVTVVDVAHRKRCKQLGIPTKGNGMIRMRKVVGDLLADNLTYNSLVHLYLCQAPKTQAEKAYTTFPTKSFNEAMEWVGKELEIVV